MKVTKTIEETVCDICKEPAVEKCEICDRDICKIHTVEIVGEPYKKDANLRQLQTFCTDCWNELKNMLIEQRRHRST